MIRATMFVFAALGAADAGSAAVLQHASATNLRITVKDYPEDARKAGETGHTTFTFVIGVDGAVTDCTIVQSSGFHSLDQQSCSIARRTTFRPARDEKGSPVSEKWSWGLDWANSQHRDIQVDRPKPIP